MRIHSYKEAIFKCEFIGESKYTMDVHIGKHHAEDFECGLCDLNTKTLEDLETHLFLCEIYKCSGCDVKVKTLSEIRSHIRNDHENSSFERIKMNRNKKTKTDSVIAIFKRKDSLIRHLLSFGSNFECGNADMCSKKNHESVRKMAELPIPGL